MKLSNVLIAASLISMMQATLADSPWLIRLRASGVLPSVSSSTISVVGGEVTKISNEVIPELDFSYFFTHHIAAKLILATSRHSVYASNTLLGPVNLGKVSVLPPILTAQYHFDVSPQLKPYVGVGVN